MSSPAAEPPARPPLDAGRLTGLGVEVVETTASTNALVAERARAGAAAGLVVVAEHQTAGRGRLDRTWETPARSGLTFSLLLRPILPAASWPWLPLLAGYAVTEALRTAGYQAGVKWPNDVLLGAAGEGKVAGILVERIETATGPAAVVGIGLNVSLTRAELPVPTATSLWLAGEADATPPDRTDLLVTLLATLRRAVDSWQEGGEQAGARLRASYAAACRTLGRAVRVDLPSGETLTGRAVDVDPGGRLLVEGPGGRTAVGAGDVVHVRAG